jgi:hypothetical protein
MEARMLANAGSKLALHYILQDARRLIGLQEAAVRRLLGDPDEPSLTDTGQYMVDTIRSRWPLLRQPPQQTADGGLVLTHSLGLDQDPYLIDHCLAGKPVLPAAVALETMAQFAAAGWPGLSVAQVLDLRVTSGVVLEGYETRELLLQAQPPQRTAAGLLRVKVELVDPRRHLACYRATVVLAETLPEPPPASAPQLHNAAPLEDHRTYSEFLFHGEDFRLIRHVVGLSEAGADATVLPSTPGELLGAEVNGAQWLFDAALMDVPSQLAFLWARVHRDMGALPARFGQVARFGNTPLHGPLTLALRLKPAPHPHALVYDAQLIDAAGRLRLHIVDGESTMDAALNRLAPDHPQFITGLSS